MVSHGVLGGAKWISSIHSSNHIVEFAFQTTSPLWGGKSKAPLCRSSRGPRLLSSRSKRRTLPTEARVAFRRLKRNSLIRPYGRSKIGWRIASCPCYCSTPRLCSVGVAKGAWQGSRGPRFGFSLWDLRKPWAKSLGSHPFPKPGMVPQVLGAQLAPSPETRAAASAGPFPLDPQVIFCLGDRRCHGSAFPW